MKVTSLYKLLWGWFRFLLGGKYRDGENNAKKTGRDRVGRDR